MQNDLIINKIKDEHWQDIPSFGGMYQANELGFIRRSGLPAWSEKLRIFRTYKQKLLTKTVHGSGYNVVSITINGKTKIYKAYHIIWAAFNGWNNFNKSGLVIDHKNNISTDDRLCNLQLITSRQNSTKDKKGYSSDFVGVSKVKETGKYIARISIKVNGKSKLINIGTFDIEADAAAAYQNALKNVSL